MRKDIPNGKDARIRAITRRIEKQKLSRAAFNKALVLLLVEEKQKVTRKDIVALLELTEPAVSRCIRELELEGKLECDRSGKHNVYSISAR